jgi:5-dehydro-2-deoxygluconokinase
MQHAHSRFAAGRPLDVICIGRLAADLYAQQVGARLEDVTSFAKYLGGSSANIAFGSARLGLRSAMLTRVGDDHMGRFLLETLAREGCDTTHIVTDRQRLTALAMLGIKDRDTFPLVFYRENCADMAFDVDDVDEAFIASSKALLVTGTHLSTEKVLAASRKAFEIARRHHVRTVLDIDYRPVLWGLTGKADGETRFIASDDVTAHLQRVLPLFDLVIGTEEEFRIAGGGNGLIESLRGVRSVTAATLVVKRGPLGCSVIEGAIPADIDEAPTFKGVPVEVFNVLGAGDAFAAGFLSGWLRDEPFETCARLANACGALVVSRHGCAPAMPTPAELDYFLAHAQADAASMRHPDRDATLARLHRVTPPRSQWHEQGDELFVFAFDHRSQMFELARETGCDEQRIETLKRLFVDAVAQTAEARNLAQGTTPVRGGHAGHPHQGHVGVLIDGRYGTEALAAATGRGWWIGRPVELPGSSPLLFEGGRSIGTTLSDWPREHTIKCLVHYHPDEPFETRLEQEAQLRALYDAAQASGHELLLEVIPPKHLSQAADVVLRALKRIYNLGIHPEWWKLEPMPAERWQAIDALIAERDPYCRGVVLLGLNAPVATLAEGFRDAAASTQCKGFMVGRTIFGEPTRAWMAGEIDDAALKARVRATFETLIDHWRAVHKPQPMHAPVATATERVA